jgi:hypothetical protein
MEVSNNLQAPAALLQGKNSLYLLHRRLDGLQSLSGLCQKRKLLAIAWNQTPSVSARSPSLYQVSYPCFPLSMYALSCSPEIGIEQHWNFALNHVGLVRIFISAVPFAFGGPQAEEYTMENHPKDTFKVSIVTTIVVPI